MENTVHYTSVNMAQLNATSSFTAGAQFASRKALYGARDEYHRKSGYKLVVKNCNKEQVIFVCHQHNAVAPQIKCPLQIRANSGKRSEHWTISPHTELSHLCNVEDHPLPSKSARGVAEHLIPRISSEFATMPTAPALVETLKSTEGTKPSFKTVYRGMQLGKDAVFGTEQQSFSLLRPYLDQLVLANPGSRSVFEVDAHNRFKRCIFVALYTARFLQHGIPCIILPPF